MRKYLFTIIVGLYSLSLSAQADEQMYTKANEAYQKNDFASAIKGYENIVKEGYESPAVYFNLGNAYYKSKDYASAILNYERAKRLAPDDEDIYFNLKLANMHVIDKIEPMPEFFLKNWWNSTADFFNLNEWAFMTISLLCLAVLSGILFLLSSSRSLKKILFLAGILFLCFFTLSFSLAQTRNKLQNNMNEAIVFAPSAYVKSSPSEKSIDLFILHEGTKVKILDQVGEYKKIRLSNGDEGWIMGKDLQAI